MRRCQQVLTVSTFLLLVVVAAAEKTLVPVVVAVAAMKQTMWQPQVPIHSP